MRKRIKTGLAVLAVSLGLAMPVSVAAGPYEDAEAADMRGDHATAFRLTRPLAEQGHASAQFNLGAMYGNGQGVPQDYAQAHKWYNLAAARFSAAEAEQREGAVKNRDIAAAKMTPQQVAEAQRLAREWKPKPEGLGR